MSVRVVSSTPSAYRYPLLIKHLLLTPLATAPEQEITYQGKVRYTYRTLKERIGRLANLLARLGVRAGQTVAVMDWDSHRYLEAFFAVPMMGAILETVNVRLSPEQILYILNHAGPEVLIVNSDFFPILNEIAGNLETVKTFVTIDEHGTAPVAPVPSAGDYEVLVAAASANYDLPDFDENAQAPTFYTTGTTGEPKGVSHTSNTMLSNLVPFAERLHLSEGDVIHMPSPMAHHFLVLL